MKTNRRKFLAGTLAAGAAIYGGGLTAFGAEAKRGQIRIGTCKLGLAAAKTAGLEGIQLPLQLAGDQLDVSQAATIQNYKQQMAETGLPICGLMMGMLNQSPLAADPRGPAWLAQAITAAKELDARVILVAFFSKGDLLAKDGQLKRDDVAAVVKRLQDAAPRAKDAGVVLAIENYLNVRQNIEILERVGHESVQVYYDVFNTGATKGYDVPAEVRQLKSRIAQFHFKNGAQFLGEGKLQFPPIAAAIREIDYRGWIVLETSSPTKDAVADARRNAEFTRQLFAAA
ncbi:MAG: sugar phosphate isomerase/epimerase [Verrucomicrobia bacterium]|nr:sugar phosphate isomerase/epimerase [Verrucomicrobiota bacterium]